MRADGHDATPGTPLTKVVGRLLDRRIGRLTGEPGRAVASTHNIALFGITATLAFVAFLVTFDFAAFGVLIAVCLGAVVAYLLCVLLARLGRQLTASVMFLLTTALELVAITVYVGWEAGFHLYLLVGGQLMFMVFTDRQATLRWVFAIGSLAAFLVAQFMLPGMSAMVQMPSVLLTALFTVNAFMTGALVFVLAAIAHFRAQRAQAAAVRLTAKAEHRANTDALTGLSNRRPVWTQLEELSVPGGEPYCLALADIDNFKTINDDHGHVCGDRVLAELGGWLGTALRGSDMVGRWGGEEFVFVMPHTDIADALGTMERVRTSISGQRVQCTDHSHNLTLSIGLTTGDDTADPRRALRRADTALYEAKRAGRDRVVVVETDGEPTPTANAQASTQ